MECAPMNAEIAITEAEIDRKEYKTRSRVAAVTWTAVEILLL
jgi:ribosomal protein L18